MDPNQRQEITACAFLYRDGRLFTARRAATKAFLPDKFELTGGHIEYGETMEGGLARELEEELHIDVVVEEPFYTFTYINSRGSHVIEVLYFVRLKNPSQEPQLNAQDHSEGRWVTAQEVSKLYKQEDPELTAILKGFELLPQRPNS